MENHELWRIVVVGQAAILVLVNWEEELVVNWPGLNMLIKLDTVVVRKWVDMEMERLGDALIESLENGLVKEHEIVMFKGLGSSDSEESLSKF